MLAVRRTRLPGSIDANASSGSIPLSIDDCILWLDATKITGLNDDDDLTTWSDLSGNGLDFTESTNEPKYRTSGINSLPSVQFGIVEATQMVTSGSPTVRDFTLFIVYYLTSYAVEFSIPFDQNPTYTGIEVIHRNTGEVYWRNVADTISDSSYGLSATHILAFKHGSELKGWMGGSEVTTGGAAAVENAKTITIGNSTANDDTVTGYIGEIIWYDRFLTSIETAKINTYLSDKWT